ETRKVKAWRLSGEGFSALSPRLKTSVRGARAALVTAWLKPTAQHHHRWRPHLKNHLFHLPLPSARCGDHLPPYQRPPPTVDGVLGEYHNLVLLHEVLVSDTALPPREVSRCLRIVERYQKELRRHAQVLGIRIYSEKPRRFVRRVRALWQANGTP